MQGPRQHKRKYGLRRRLLLTNVKQMENEGENKLRGSRNDRGAVTWQGVLLVFGTVPLPPTNVSSSFTQAMKATLREEQWNGLEIQMHSFHC